MILIDIYVASLGESFDFRVDETAKIIKVLSEISEMLTVKYRTTLNKPIGEFMLCSYDQKKVLDNNQTLWENNITNGTKLLLV
ncbi:MAG: hypothetical protein Q4D54_06260 [Eubacteriales bacterium]|nr:hypothetical protein [Lachnospiraceae bacterium]MDO5127332.1 hypothetical protein [Eubacteriales bacterium]